MSELLKPLEGKVLVYLRDPIFGNCGWCIEASLIVSMQTMNWVDPLVGRPGKVGEKLLVKGGELVPA